MILNVEEDLRKRVIPTPEVGLFDPNNDDIEPIPFVHPTLTAIRKIKLKADNARTKFLDESELSSNSAYFADVEYNETLKFWVVVFSLSVDDQAAYVKHGQQYMEDYVENKLGSKFYGLYEDLAIDIIQEIGLTLKSLEDETEEQITEESLTDVNEIDPI